MLYLDESGKTQVGVKHMESSSDSALLGWTLQGHEVNAAGEPYTLTVAPNRAEVTPRK